jgi:hypothetical protein
MHTSLFLTIYDPPRSSTPKEGILQEANVEKNPIGGKHHLTPSSKQSLPKPKRFNVGM